MNLKLFLSRVILFSNITDCDIVIERDTSVSRRHASLHVDEGTQVRWHGREMT